MDKYSDEHILNEIRRVARELGQEKLAARDFSANSKLSLGTVINRFGAWNAAAEKAGLEPIDRIEVAQQANQRAMIPEDELLLDLLRLAALSGGACPTIASISSQGQFSPSVYKRRFGSHASAFRLACERFPDGATQSGVSRSRERSKCAPLSSGLKLVSADAQRPQTLYGERIDFRGLTFAPTNELGVVFLFGMVARELGFCIESVRSEYPDCEGKMCVSRDGDKWAHVRIEFEYRSSNFGDHGHSPDGCDLIVCWVHDWSECPKEVVELKSAISSLRQGD